MKTEILKKADLAKAADFLRRGELVAFPTETVFGLGANLFMEDAVEKVFAVKGRPQDNPLIAHIASVESAYVLAEELPDAFFLLAEAFWPGPLTLVVKKTSLVPSIVSGGLETIALRMPSHPIAQELIENVGAPLVAPSANLSGKPSGTLVEHVLADFAGKIAAIIDEPACEYGIESTVLNLTTEVPTLLRAGAISEEELETVVQITPYEKGAMASPGMRYRHYAPQAKVAVCRSREELRRFLATGKNPLIVSSYTIDLPHQRLDEQTFYATLREADQAGYEEIVLLFDEKISTALKDRISKASTV